MLFLNAESIHARATMRHLIDGLEAAFRADWTVPPRQVMRMPGGAGDRLFVSMPAFDEQGGGAIKLVTVCSDNLARGVPTNQAVIEVFSDVGTPIAVLDGTTVTNLRTGAASALASQYLSRADSAHLVVLGTGALAPYMAWAHCTARPIQRVSVWGRQMKRVTETVRAIQQHVPGIDVRALEQIEQSVAEADIVCCATRSSTPIVQGQSLRLGTFIDLVGSFSRTDRESDDAVLLRARIFVDTFAGAFAEAGDILEPMSRGVISKAKVEAELADNPPFQWITGEPTTSQRSLDRMRTKMPDLYQVMLVQRNIVSGWTLRVEHRRQG